jgi:hypothetical protein
MKACATMLKANGKNAPYLRYILLNEIQGNDCGSTPWRNHAADQTGRLSAPSAISTPDCSCWTVTATGSRITTII